MYIGLPEALVILALVLLLLFAPSKLPQLAKAIGQSIREIKKATKESEEGGIDKEKIVKIAQELGIETEGKSKEELMKEVMEKLGKGKTEKE